MFLNEYRGVCRPVHDRELTRTDVTELNGTYIQCLTLEGAYELMRIHHPHHLAGLSPQQAFYVSYHRQLPYPRRLTSYIEELIGSTKYEAVVDAADEDVVHVHLTLANYDDEGEVTYSRGLKLLSLAWRDRWELIPSGELPVDLYDVLGRGWAWAETPLTEVELVVVLRYALPVLTNAWVTELLK